MRESLKEYCSRYDRLELLEQWHPEKNGSLTPDEISYGSHKKIWWRCSQGHEWESPPYTRAVAGSGCPYCTGKKVLPGLDFQSVYPDIAQQWHPDKNGSFKPEQFLPGSHKSVWWQCERGHEWKALIKSRVEGNGCPVCANRVVLPGENDLETCAPLIAKEWHPTKNGMLSPGRVVSGSTKKVWWKCERGHEWQAEIQSRVSGKGCPVCAGKVVVPGENDLESYAPQIAAQWNHEKNGSLHSNQVSAYSNKQVWWRCQLGHEWKCAVYSRTFKQSECPYCSGKKVLPGFNDLKTKLPKVAAQWHPTRNDKLQPSMVLPGCRKRVWWMCSDGHEWRAIIYSRTGTQMCGCPECAGKAARQY